MIQLISLYNEISLAIYQKTKKKALNFQFFFLLRWQNAALHLPGVMVY